MCWNFYQLHLKWICKIRIHLNFDSRTIFLVVKFFCFYHHRKPRIKSRYDAFTQWNGISCFLYKQKESFHWGKGIFVYFFLILPYQIIIMFPQSKTFIFQNKFTRLNYMYCDIDNFLQTGRSTVQISHHHLSRCWRDYSCRWSIPETLQCCS